MYARITTTDGSFNETCDVSAAGAMVAYGMITYDGEAARGEHCYTVPDDGTAEVLRSIAAWEDSQRRASHSSPGTPGYPGEPPVGVSWESWLALNNVD